MTEAKTEKKTENDHDHNHKRKRRNGCDQPMSESTERRTTNNDILLAPLPPLASKERKGKGRDRKEKGAREVIGGKGR